MVTKELVDMNANDDKPDNNFDSTLQKQDQQFTGNLRPFIISSLETIQWVENIIPKIFVAEQLVEKVTSTFSDIVNQILDTAKPSAGLAKRFEELSEKFKVTEEEAVKILNKYKWPVSSSMPLSFLFEVIEIGRQKGNQRGAINKLFVDYFSANDFEQLSELIEAWRSNPVFEPRMKIFRDCVVALKQANDRYNASNIVLPTLIAQIDGILTDYMEQKEVGRNRKWKSEFRALTANQYFSDSFSDLASDILLDLLFQKAIPGQPLEVPFTFSRHKIMHGEYTRYGRIDNTLRAFLILDFLSGLQ